MNINYDLWNTTGESITIPDGVTTFWPAGDALVQNFVYNKGHLVGFVDTKALVTNESKSTTFPYDYVNITVDKSLEGVMTFNPGERTKVSIVNYAETGNTGDTVVLGTVFANCRTIDEVKSISPDYQTEYIIDGVWNESLEKLEDSNPDRSVGMFASCNNLTTFTSDLNSLTNGYRMFYNCSNLTEFNISLSSLTDGGCMFGLCRKIKSFTSDLSSLSNGHEMFIMCSNLTTFNGGDLSSLTNGAFMFSYCPNFTTFNDNLSSLTDGEYMFYGCKLDVASVQNIA